MVKYSVLKIFLSKLQVLFGLEYTHAMQCIKEALKDKISSLCGSNPQLELHFADVKCATMNPSEDYKSSMGHQGASGGCTANVGCDMAAGASYSTGGLEWNLPEDCKVEDYLLFWIGSDNAAFANVVLTFNGCDIGRIAKFLVILTAMSPNKISIHACTYVFCGYCTTAC